MIIMHERGVLHGKEDEINDSERMVTQSVVGTQCGRHKDLRQYREKIIEAKLTIDKSTLGSMTETGSSSQKGQLKNSDECMP